MGRRSPPDGAGGPSENQAFRPIELGKTPVLTAFDGGLTLPAMARRTPLLVLVLLALCASPLRADPPKRSSAVNDAKKVIKDSTDKASSIVDEADEEVVDDDFGDTMGTPTPSTDENAARDSRRTSRSSNRDETATNDATSPENPPDQVTVVPERKIPLPEAVQQQETAAREALVAGDAPTALIHIKEARKAAPEDPQLLALEKLAETRVSRPDPNLFKKKIDGLLDARSDNTPDAQQGAIYASPIAWAGGGAKTPEFTAISRNPAQDALLKAKLTHDFAEAESALSRRIGDNPLDWRAWRDRAIVRLKIKRFQEAHFDALKAGELKPDDSAVRRLEALVLAEMGRLAEAVDRLSDWLAAHPRDAQALAQRAGFHGRLGNDEAMIVDLRAAAASDAQFEALLQEALQRKDAPRRRKTAQRYTLYGTALLSALVLFSYVVFRRRGATTGISPMRAEDRAHAAMPAGFRVTRQIGEGGMGMVYEAVDEALQRKVALKKLRPEIAVDPRERRRFLKEARTVAGLRHPHIVEIHSVVEHPDGLFLVFEYVDGQTLADAVEDKPLPPEAALRLGRQVAEALDYAHAHGVVHQDLKPSNIMVAGGLPKVMDFGIARRLFDTMSTMGKNETVGTPAYMAPEQERGAAGPASDVYAFGLCLYEMLSGRRAYPVSATYFQKLEKAFIPLSKVASVPAEADAVISAALDPDPAKRPPTATALVDALEKAFVSTPRA